MACDHPRDRWVGTESGICCGVCGAKVDPGAKPAPAKKAEPKEEKADPVKAEPKKAAPKKGGKK